MNVKKLIDLLRTYNSNQVVVVANTVTADDSNREIFQVKGVRSQTPADTWVWSGERGDDFEITDENSVIIDSYDQPSIYDHNTTISELIEMLQNYKPDQKVAITVPEFDLSEQKQIAIEILDKVYFNKSCNYIILTSEDLTVPEQDHSKFDPGFKIHMEALFDSEDPISQKFKEISKLIGESPEFSFEQWIKDNPTDAQVMRDRLNSHTESYYRLSRP